MTIDPEKAAGNGAASSGEPTSETAAEPAANDAPRGAESPAGAPARADAGPRAPSAPPPAEPGPEQKLTDSLAECARLRDQLLRTAADFDNYRKRSRRAEDEALRRGREQMLKDLLPVFDNLERAVQHAESAPDAGAVVAGLRMVLKQFVDTLERAGIKRIPTVGLPFDPTHHEAIQQLESKDPAGVVIAEVQPGYTMGDTLVRAAMVVVSKGPPAGEAAAS